MKDLPNEGELRRLLALEILFQHMADESRCAGAASSQGVELGFESFWNLNEYSLHLHVSPYLL